MKNTAWKKCLLGFVVLFMLVPSTASSLIITENYSQRSQPDWQGNYWYDVRFDVQVAQGESPVQAFAVAYKTYIMDVWINNIAPDGMILPASWLSTGFIKDPANVWKHWGQGSYTNPLLAGLADELALLSGEYIQAAGYCNYSGSDLIGGFTYSGFMTIVYPASTYVALHFDGSISRGETVEVGKLPQVPLPATILLLGPGLVGLAGLRRKLKK